MLKFTVQKKRKAKNGSTSGSEAPGSPASGSFTSSASSGSGESRHSLVSGSPRRPSSLAPSDDSEGKSPSETYSTSQDSDLGSFTMEFTNGHLQGGGRGRKNVSFEPKGVSKVSGSSTPTLHTDKQDTVYMIESAHDSSSGIASDEHNSSPNGHTTSTSTSDPTYGFPTSRADVTSSKQRYSNDVGNVSAHVQQLASYPNNPAFRDMPPPAANGYFRRPTSGSASTEDEKEHALSVRARLPAEPLVGGGGRVGGGGGGGGGGGAQRCLSPQNGRQYHRTFSPLTTEEVILNQKNMFQYMNPQTASNNQQHHPQQHHPQQHHPQQHHNLSPQHHGINNIQDTNHLISFGHQGGVRQQQQQQQRFKDRQYRKDTSAQYTFDMLPDDVIIRIFSNLSSIHMCRSARVCRRWYHLVWEPCLWTSIRLSGSDIDADRALKVLTRRLSYDTPNVCVMVEKVFLSGCEQLTDKGLHTISRRCPELRHLELQNCVNVTNIALFEVVSKCVNMEHLNVSGCPEVTCICLTPEATVQAPAYGRQIYLRHLDMTDCSGLEDSGLQIIASYCPQLVFLYLRRCLRLTDLGVQYVANYCTNIREFSISDCRKVTDFGMRELAKLGPNLRYLSVAKCDKISDVGVKYIAQCCHKLRYLNVRGCEAVSDEAIELVAKYCKRLKSLDIGKCDVTDEGLQVVAENCPSLRRLSLKSCDAITDRGVTVLAYYCRHLQQINIQECQVSVESYRAVKKYCKRCIIEHTNPGFY